MPRRNAYLVDPINSLDGRLLLSHVAVPVSIVASGLYPHQQVLNRRQLPIVGEVNLTFASFQSDYGQARSAYFASILNQAPGSPAANDATNAFKQYTTERVSLLAQQLISDFLQSPQGTVRTPGRPDTLARLISTKIINVSKINSPTDPGKQVPGSLILSLMGTIPSVGVSPSTASLYTLSQDNAIAAAQAAILNGGVIMKHNLFGNERALH